MSRASRSPSRPCSRSTAGRGERIDRLGGAAELVYLAESGRLTAEQVRLVDDALQAEDSAFEVYAVDERVARAVADVPRAEVPNPQDGLIAATARVLGVPLIPKDRALHACAAVTTIW
jgi:predicted nucleic acid-binding protein